MAGDRRQVPQRAFTADAAAAIAGPEWLRSRRVEAFERFAATELPTPADEVWRYSRIDELDLDAYAPVAEGGGDGPAGGVLAAMEVRSGLVVTHNGRIVRTELDPALAGRGVTLGGLASDPEGPDRLGSVAAAPDAYVDLATAFLVDGVLLRVPSGVVVPDPIVVLHQVDQPGGAVFGRTVVQAGEGSQVTVGEYLGSPGDLDALVCPVVELDVADAANVSYLGVQELGRRVWQLGYQASRIGRDATLRSYSVALGGSYARTRTDSRLAGQGATANLLAAFFGDGEQMHDFRTMQDHAAPRTTSDLLFKGAVKDRAHSVYSGLIRVRKGAAGTNAFQTNRNLVLSEGARANSVPNLEIDENDLSCSHASAVGPIDEDQRYYLACRGVPPEVADRLIVLGFFDEIVERAPVPEVRGALRQAVSAKLGHGGEGEGTE